VSGAFPARERFAARRRGGAVGGGAAALLGLLIGCSEYNVSEKIGGEQGGLTPEAPVDTAAPDDGAEGVGGDGGSDTQNQGADGTGGAADGGGTDGTDGGSSDGGGTDGTDGGSSDGGGTDGTDTGGTGGGTGTDTGGTGGGTGTDTGGTGGGSGTDTGTAPTPDDPEAFCTAASTTATFLDAWQVAGDGKVVFCHSTGSGWNVIDTAISACVPHLSHTADILPTTLCDS
jgi:hypothetical protein